MSLLSSTSNYFRALFFGDNQNSPQPAPQSESKPTAFDEQTYLKEQGKKEVLFTKSTISRPDISGVNLRSRRTLYTIVLVLGLLLLIMQQFALLLVIGSLVFIQVALSRTQPDTVSYEVSNWGVMYADKMYYWPQLMNYYFGQKNNLSYIGIKTEDPLPGRIFLFIDASDASILDPILENHLTKLDGEPQTFIDKAYTSVSEKFDI